jgi:putative phosphoesterase
MGREGEESVIPQGNASPLTILPGETGSVIRLLLVSDTHVPSRARDLPAAVWAEVDAADVVVHAGDWTDVRLLDRLESRAARLVGVVGNNDEGELRRRLPEIARVELEGIRLAVVHETGSKEGRERRMEAAFPDTDLLVFGHSHIPWDSTTPGGLRLLNPGSPTDRRRQPVATIMRLTIDDGAPGVPELVAIAR